MYNNLARSSFWDRLLDDVQFRARSVRASQILVDVSLDWAVHDAELGAVQDLLRIELRMIIHAAFDD
jgi:hypothetical protein